MLKHYDDDAELRQLYDAWILNTYAGMGIDINEHPPAYYPDTNVPMPPSVFQVPPEVDQTQGTEEDIRSEADTFYEGQ